MVRMSRSVFWNIFLFYGLMVRMCRSDYWNIFILVPDSNCWYCNKTNNITPIIRINWVQESCPYHAYNSELVVIVPEITRRSSNQKVRSNSRSCSYDDWFDNMCKEYFLINHNMLVGQGICYFENFSNRKNCDNSTFDVKCQPKRISGSGYINLSCLVPT